jgi:hypothetical protein
MDQIIQPIKQAERRLRVARFFYLLSWTLLFGLAIGLIGLAIPRFWYLSGLENPRAIELWNYSWLAGGILSAVLAAVLLTLRQRESRWAVAAEVDKRFQLKERLSSVICLKPEELQTPVGQALLQDAIARAEVLEVAEQFQFQPSRVGILPLIPALLIFGVFFIPLVGPPEIPLASDTEPVDRQQIERLIEEAKKRKEQRQQPETRELSDAESDSRKLEKKFDSLLEAQNLDKKTALVKLNDIKQQIEDRKAQLENSRELKQSLNRLKDAAQGPARQLSEAIGKGDLPEAQQAIRQLAKKIREGNLSGVEQKKLAADLENMAAELKKMAQQKQEEQRRLEQDLKKAIEQGDLDQAAGLQEKIDQARRQPQGIENMQKLADKLRESADSLKQESAGSGTAGSNSQREGGQGSQAGSSRQQAADALDEIADRIAQMQSDLEDLKDLEELENLARQCQNCLGGDCLGGGNQDWAQGAAPAGGRRGIEEDETGAFRSRVRARLQKGETVITGTADGDNIAGKSASEARELVQRAISRENDPLENQTLPRAQREHARQYFEALRKNQK